MASIGDDFCFTVEFCILVTLYRVNKIGDEIFCQRDVVISVYNTKSVINRSLRDKV